MKIRKAGLVVVAVLLGLILFFNRSDVTLTTQNNFELNPIGSSGYQLNSVIHLNNPNFLSSTIKNIHEDFYLNGVQVGTFASDINQGIPRRKETEFPINIRFNQADYQKATLRDSSHLGVVVMGQITFQNIMTGGTIEVKQVGAITAKSQ